MLISTAAGVGVDALVGFDTAGALVCAIAVIVVAVSSNVQPVPVEFNTNPESQVNEVDEQVAAGGHGIQPSFDASNL